MVGTCCRCCLHGLCNARSGDLQNSLPLLCIPLPHERNCDQGSSGRVLDEEDDSRLHVVVTLSVLMMIGDRLRKSAQQPFLSLRYEDLLACRRADS